jgi:hypothetical protein
MPNNDLLDMSYYDSPRSNDKPINLSTGIDPNTSYAFQKEMGSIINQIEHKRVENRRPHQAYGSGSKRYESSQHSPERSSAETSPRRRNRNMHDITNSEDDFDPFDLILDKA